MAKAGTILVLGIGNLLKGDDGVGVRVVEALERQRLPRGVECLDGGTGGPSLIAHFEGLRALVIIDAVNLDRPPGSIRAFGLEEIEDAESTARFSLHELGIMPMLELARQIGRLPPVVRIVGVQPERFDRALELSPAVEAAVPKAVEVVLKEIADLSCG